MRLLPSRAARRLVQFVVFATVACQGLEVSLIGPGAPGSGGGPGQPVFTVLLTPTNAAVAAGASVQLGATVLDSLGVLVGGAQVSWTTGNPAVATVSPAGLVTGVAPGGVTIGAGFGGVTANANITVTNVPVATVTVTPSADTLQLGSTVFLSAVPRDASGNALVGRIVTWQSNNSAVASVNTSGLVTANAVGLATITAISEGQAGTSAITVQNIPVATVTVTPAQDTVFVGANVTFTAVARDAGGNVLTGRAVTWQSSNTTVATINSGTGVALGRVAGTTTITANVGGVNGTATLDVALVPVAAVQVAPPTANVTVGGTVQLSATPRDAAGNSLTGRVVTWSSNSANATVNPTTGLVTGQTAGPATITATCEGQTGQSAVTVVVAPPTLVRVMLLPDTVIVNTGTTRQFTVQGKFSDSSVASISVTYSATGGTVSQLGLYAAGNTAGTFRVIAAAQGQPFADTSGVTIVVPPPVPVATVTVTPAIDTAFIGQTTTFTATARDAGGNILTGRPVTWQSSSPANATVISGVVTGVATGQSTITATIGGVNGTATAVVMPVPVATVQVTPASASVVVGATVQLNATTRDAGGNVLTGRVITWSSNSANATVNPGTGLVTGQTPGPATITASSEGRTGTSNITVTLPPPTLVRVMLTPDTATLLAGGSRQFIGEGKFSDSSVAPTPLTYSTSGGSVTPQGLYVAPQVAGTFLVVARSQSLPLADTSRVVVTAAPPPGTYVPFLFEDWTVYSNDASLMLRGLFGWGASGAAGPIDNYVDLVPDGTFGQVVRILQQGGIPNSPQMHRQFPVPLDKGWVRWRIRFSPGWTAVGSTGPSLGNAWKQMHLYMPNGGASGRTRVDVENSTQFGCGFGFPNRTFTETPLPGHQGGGAGCGTALVAGGVGDEFNDGEWYEWIAYHEKTGSMTGRVRFWHRKLTQGGVIVNNAFRFSGWSYVGVTGTDVFPQVHELALGVNKNRDTPVDQYVYWGPWEIVNGAQFPNPWGVGP